MKVLPNLIIPGAGKSGTSSLHRMLDQHPEIFMSPLKEPGYFFHDHLYEQKLNWYSDLFLPGRDLKYRGESSTSYFKRPLSLERMKRDLDNPKFIIILRHPVKRVVSHYNWILGKGLEFRSFRNAVSHDMEEEFRPGIDIRGRFKCYIQNSYYARWIGNYIRVFGRENVHVVTFEKLKADPIALANDCFAFLGLTPLTEIDTRIYNKTEFQQMPIWDRYLLNVLFQNNDRSVSTKMRDILLPDFIKEFYWKNHNRINGVKLLKEPPPIASADYQWLWELLKEDVTKLKQLLKYNFDEWEDYKEL